jgi:C_GCAxxG_C_C family probable redox protein
MDSEDYIKKAYELGFKYERDYHGCAQSTIAAVQDSLGVRNDAVFQTASGIAGGGGIIGDGVCGGYSGGCIVMGMFFGRRREKFDNDNEYKEISYKHARMLHDRFEKEYGGVICREVQAKIFGRYYNLLDTEEKKQFEEAGAHEDKCTCVVGNASAWVTEILLEEIEQRGLNLDYFKHLIYISE